MGMTAGQRSRDHRNFASGRASKRPAFFFARKAGPPHIRVAGANPPSWLKADR